MGTLYPPSFAHRPDRPMAALARAIAVSVLLHLVAFSLLEPRTPPYHGSRALAPPLLARLQAPSSAPPLPPTPLPVDATETASLAKPTDPAANADGAALTRKAGFALPPNFWPVESLSVAGTTRLKLRLHVSALGALQRIDILESELVTPDFLAAVYEQLELARFAPAESLGRKIPGAFEILIVAQPAGAAVVQSPLGNGKVTASE